MALISAERLHRWKCQYCGSKDKNVSDVKKVDPDGVEWTPVKIVSCSQCGNSMIFSHSSLALALFMNGDIEKLTIDQSEDYVRQNHMINHNDPMRNPHSAHDMSKNHNPHIIPKHRNPN